MSAPATGRPGLPNDVRGPAATTAARFDSVAVPVPEALLSRLTEAGVAVDRTPEVRQDAGRDWWPLSIGWAEQGVVPALPVAVVSPTSTAQVSTVLAACSAAGVPVTAAGGRSGVCGATIPLYGGIALDMTGLHGVVRVDETSLVADVRAGTFGPDLEAALGACGEGYTLGHWPQSMELSTVGGWLACRGAGQYSTRYGKIEDLVVGLEVVLADGTIIHTDGMAPRAATGPSLTQLFVGSEGTLGVIAEAQLRIHPRPPVEDRRAYGFPSFADGVGACRRILRRGATPAVLRLYDPVESDRNFEEPGTCVLIVLDEADPALLAATMAVVDEECGGAARLDDALVGRWLEHRNDVSALAPLWQGGIVVDTAEVAGKWAVLPELASTVVASLQTVPGTLVASTHQSHAYADGACLYFTFAGRQPEGDGAGGTGQPASTAAGTATATSAGGQPWAETYYRQAWDTLTEVVERHGAAISHHHGIGLNRARFLPDALGAGYEVLVVLKRALDPTGVLNPGKLGLPVPASWAAVPWP